MRTLFSYPAWGTRSCQTSIINCCKVIKSARCLTMYGPVYGGQQEEGLSLKCVERRPPSRVHGRCTTDTSRPGYITVVVGPGTYRINFALLTHCPLLLQADLCTEMSEWGYLRLFLLYNHPWSLFGFRVNAEHKSRTVLVANFLV